MLRSELTVAGGVQTEERVGIWVKVDGRKSRALRSWVFWHWSWSATLQMCSTNWTSDMVLAKGQGVTIPALSVFSWKCGECCLLAAIVRNNIGNNLRSCELAEERPIEHRLKRATQAHSEKALRLLADSLRGTERTTN